MTLKEFLQNENIGRVEKRFPLAGAIDDALENICLVLNNPTDASSVEEHIKKHYEKQGFQYKGKSISHIFIKEKEAHIVAVSYQLGSRIVEITVNDAPMLSDLYTT